MNLILKTSGNKRLVVAFVILGVWAETIRCQSSSSTTEDTIDLRKKHRLARQETITVPSAASSSGSETNGFITKPDKGLQNVVSIEVKHDSTSNQRNVHICSGFIVSEFLVLSSFSCVTSVNSVSEELQLRTGSTNAESGGYVYNVFQSYGINLRLAKPVEIKETWGSTLRKTDDQKYRAYDNYALPQLGRAGDKAKTNSTNVPKKCEKSPPLDAYRAVQEFFEAERYLGDINPEFLILLTCEPIKRTPADYGDLAFYKGPFRPNNAIMVSFNQNTKQMQKVLIGNAPAPECMHDFKDAYRGYESGPTLENRFQCITDRISNDTRRSHEFCDSTPGAPVFINYDGRYQFQGVSLHHRTCRGLYNPVMIRLFDRQIARPLSQVLYE